MRSCSVSRMAVFDELIGKLLFGEELLVRGWLWLICCLRGAQCVNELFGEWLVGEEQCVL